MRFAIVSQATGLSFGEYDETAPVVRLLQGKPREGLKRPLDLVPGEKTHVIYPLDGFDRGETRTIEFQIVRVDGVTASDEENRKADIFREEPAPRPPEPTEAPPPVVPAPSAAARRRRVARPA